MLVTDILQKCLLENIYLIYTDAFCYFLNDVYESWYDVDLDLQYEHVFKILSMS